MVCVVGVCVCVGYVVVFEYVEPSIECSVCTCKCDLYVCVNVELLCYVCDVCVV